MANYGIICGAMDDEIEAVEEGSAGTGKSSGLFGNFSAKLVRRAF
jgi:hypothetical protein